MRARWHEAAPRRPAGIRHAVLVACRRDAGAVLLGAEDVADRREHLRLSAASDPVSMPNLFHYVDVWYFIPFPRYLLNSVVVSLLAVAGNLVLNAMAGYALTQNFAGRQAVILLLLSCMLIPFQATIIPAYLITAKLGLLNSVSRPGVAAAIDDHLHLRVQVQLRGGAPIADRRSADRRAERARILLDHAAVGKSAMATNVILSFIWSWNAFLWPLIVTRTPDMQTLPLGLARFLSYMEDTTGRAVCLRGDGAGAGVVRVLHGAEGVHSRTDGRCGERLIEVLREPLRGRAGSAGGAGGGWNVYVGAARSWPDCRPGGGCRGHPVAGATVMLFEQQFANQVEQARTKTAADGRFGFDWQPIASGRAAGERPGGQYVRAAQCATLVPRTGRGGATAPGRAWRMRHRVGFLGARGSGIEPRPDACALSSVG